MPAGYYRFPTIHHDHVVFTCEDDLWSVSVDGGIARRLTSGLGEASRPSLSPDGAYIAFVGREEGQPEIYLMPSNGGPARRMTFSGSSLCLTAGWTQDGQILYANNAGHWYLRYTDLYRIDLDGIITPLNLGLGRAISFGPQGGVVIGRHTDDPARWKRYRGGTAGQLWIDENGSGDFQQLLPGLSNLTSPMWLKSNSSDGRIYFISDHEGIGNLYSSSPQGVDVQRHTDHTNFYARNASTDGERIVYHAGADLYVFDPQSGLSRMIPVEFNSPQTQRSRKFVDASQYLQDWKLHPSGQALTITSRGKVFTFANWEGAVIHHSPRGESNANNSIETGIRCRLPRWLNDGERVIAVTDEGGEEAFVIFYANGLKSAVILNGLDIGRPDNVVVNPRKDVILFSNHRYELIALDLGTQLLTTIDRGTSRPIEGMDWSPDGRWAVYSASISLQKTAVKLWDSQNNSITQITEPILKDVQPNFDPQGNYLYFLSYRTFSPIYDNLQFDLGFPLGMKPYLLTLRKDIPSPFIPQPRLEPKQESIDEKGSASKHDEQEQKEDRTVNEKADKENEKEEEAFAIDIDGIERRIIAFPVDEGLYGKITGIMNGKVLYTQTYPEDATSNAGLDTRTPDYDLMSYNFEDHKEELLFRKVQDYDVSADRKYLVYRTKYSLRVLKAGEKPMLNGDGEVPSRRNGWIDLDRVRVPILPGAEWRQMFREAWRLQRDQFWTKDMSQVDWVAIHNQYLPLVDRISSRSEFSDLMWEMQGELGTSHAYEFGGDYRPEPRYSLGFLGADFSFDAEEKAWVVGIIYDGDHWDAKNDSPLNTPGTDIRSGDYLTAINGIRLSQSISPASILVNQANQEVTLSVLQKNREKSEDVQSPEVQSEPVQEDQAHSDTSSEKHYTVRTLTNESGVRYRAWVKLNREIVHAKTNGLIGYIHIPDMGPLGFAEFHRGYLSEVDRPGLIVDLRFNRGGFVSGLLLQKLARRRLGYDVSRWSQSPSPYFPESLLGPLVAITNEYAGSDGDIFSHGFKLLKLGPLLGKRTWGGVVGIWPRHSLVDGTITTQPEFSFWFHDVGWGVENYGTDPDIQVDITPQDYAQGKDTQLERAIAEIKRLLDENPPELPAMSERPSKAIPRLPRR